MNNRPSWYCTDSACCDHHMLFSLKYCTYENIIIIITALVIVTYCLILRERKKSYHPSRAKVNEGLMFSNNLTYHVSYIYMIPIAMFFLPNESA